MSPPADATAPSGSALDDLLPDATVDSRWWYWVAAVPAYFVVAAVLGLLLFAGLLLGVGVFAFAFDAGLSLFLLLVVGGFLIGLPGLLLSVLFPVALYVDAGAVAASDADWDPDPLLWGLVGVASVVATAYTVSVVVALYYLYRRHGAVGTP